MFRPIGPGLLARSVALLMLVLIGPKAGQQCKVHEGWHHDAAANDATIP